MHMNSARSSYADVHRTAGKLGTNIFSCSIQNILEQIICKYNCNSLQDVKCHEPPDKHDTSSCGCLIVLVLFFLLLCCTW